MYKRKGVQLHGIFSFPWRRRVMKKSNLLEQNEREWKYNFEEFAISQATKSRQSTIYSVPFPKEILSD